MISLLPAATAWLPTNVTVKELKEALHGVPEEVSVIILVDGYESESKEPWMARHLTDADEDGTVTEEFRVNC